MSAEEIKDTLQLQLSEVEMLGSMFSNPGEFVLEDPACLENVQNFIDGSVSYDTVKCRIGFTVQLKNVGEMVCHYPHEYPSVPPEVFVRAKYLSKTQHRQLSEDLMNFIQEQGRNDLIVASIIQWLQVNVETYENAKVTPESPSKKASGATQKVCSKFCRMWIYSHHIYSKIKRKDILELTLELNLTGFTLPGKPGIIVVEGDCDSVEEFWGTIRRWQWKKLTMKEKEECEIGDKTIDEFRKFPNYEEKNFDARPGKGRGIHMDLGMLYTFLEKRGCGHIFPLYFGVDGKSHLEED